MKARFLIPVLALLLTLTLLCPIYSACNAAPEGAPAEKHMGEFYQENGIWQNTLVRMIITEQPLEEPQCILFYRLCNDSDYELMLNYKKDIFVEVYQDGEWGSPELSKSGAIPENLISPARMRANYTTARDASIRFGENLLAHHPHYAELPAGLYRLRLPYRFCDLPEGTLDYNTEFVAYFTVEPSPE